MELWKESSAFHSIIRTVNFKKDLQDENKKKKELGDIPTKTGKVCIWKGGYEKRYGDRWKAELKTAVEKTKLSMKDMIDHMISESKKVLIITKEHNWLMLTK